MSEEMEGFHGDQTALSNVGKFSWSLDGLDGAAWQFWWLKISWKSTKTACLFVVSIFWSIPTKSIIYYLNFGPDNYTGHYQLSLLFTPHFPHNFAPSLSHIRGIHIIFPFKSLKFRLIVSEQNCRTWAHKLMPARCCMVSLVFRFMWPLVYRSGFIKFWMILVLVVSDI